VTWTIEAVQEADVDPAAVFALYADPSTWSSWGHNATWAEADGPMVDGGIVRVRAGYGTVYRCRIRRFELDRALELVVKPVGLTIVNVYEVEPTPSGGSRVRHAFAVSGPIAGIARIALARVYQRQLVEEVAAVIRIARDPAAALADRTPDAVTPPERAWHRLGRVMRGGREEQR
jgi:hypothetical protein